MKKKYTLLNSSFEIEGPKELINYIDQDIIELPLYTKNVREYRVSYVLDSKLYDEIEKDLKKQNIKKIRIFGDEYKYRIENSGIVFLMDNDSIIVHSDNKFSFYGKKEFSMNQVIYLIHEAVYEGFILDNDLMLHCASFASNHELANIIVGVPGIGKTTFLMECLLKLNASYISNDLVGIHNNKAIASIIPVRIAHGTLARFHDRQYDNLKEKETYMLKKFLNEYSLQIDSNVKVKNIIFPQFDINNKFDITKIDKKEAKDLLIDQTLNYYDEERPYLWVNEIDLNQVKRKQIDTKLNNLIGSTESFYVTYGSNIVQDDIKVLRKVIKM